MAKKILFCNCAFADIIPKEVKQSVFHNLEESGVEFESVPDLCELSAKKDKRLDSLSKEKDLEIVACFPRAVKWLFQAGGTEKWNEKTIVHNMRTKTADEILKALLPSGTEVAKPAVREVAGENGENIETAKIEGKWKPWFPVIDYDRCTNCMQCLSFCLFDVYAVDQDQKIKVQNQTKCKTDCPACSRVCPDVAILFPKYSGGPINGDEVREEDLSREKMKVDISSLLGGNIYDNLRNRSTERKKRFAQERDDKKALAERKKCLVKLKDLDIPDHVLNSLPTDAAIARKAREMFADDQENSDDS